MIKPEEEFFDLFEKYMTRHAPQPHPPWIQRFLPSSKG